MEPALAQVCSLPYGFAEDIAAYAGAGFRHMEVWLTKLEDYLGERSAEELHQLLERHNLAIPVASFQGGLFSVGSAQDEAWRLFRQRLNLCRQCRITTLVVAADVGGPMDLPSAQRVVDVLKQAADEAARAGVRLALEFRATSALLNNLQTTLATVAQIQNPYLGVCLDVIHFYTGPSKTEDLQYLTAEHLFHVQVADIADVPRELASDSHRILPGEGDICLAAVMQALRRIGYRGLVSLELMNPQLWHIEPHQLAQVAMASLRRLVG